MKDYGDNNKHQKKEISAQKPPDSKTDQYHMFLPDFLINRRSPVFSFIVFPFHHLVSGSQLTTANTSFPSAREDRRQFFWQRLAEQGIPASEAALLNDSFNLHFVERVTGAAVEVDWEVLYHHELQGCAELYRAELFTWKRLIYEAGNDLSPNVELTAQQIPELPEIILPAADRLRGNNRLFLNNLTASFDLAFSTNILETERDRRREAETQTRRKRRSVPEYFSRFYSYGSKRAESWTAVSKNAAFDEKLETQIDSAAVSAEDAQDSPHRTADVTYRIRLSEYWIVWQQAARTSRFDFDYLETVSEDRSLRFYELTKLWRALSINNGGTVSPGKIEIEYEKLAALMPIPLMNSEREIKDQVAKLINPLKAGGYVKSFSLRGGVQDIGWRRASLVFRFGD